MKTQDIYTLGQKLNMRASSLREKAKVGTLRAGTTGILDASGRAIGVCPARAFLRMEGVAMNDEDESDGRVNRELMFEAGRSNEDIWAANLESAGYTVLREDDKPTTWTLDGVDITGRPDIVIYDGLEPIRGLELKLVSSLWKAKNYFFNRVPNLAHIMQATHYSNQLKIPFEIWYTNRASFAVTGDWAKYMFPKFGEPLSEYCDYTYYKNTPDGRGGVKRSKTEEKLFKDGMKNLEFIQINKMNGKTKVMEKKWIPEWEAEIKAILPFIQGYGLRVEENGSVSFRDLSLTEEVWHPTIVTLQGIHQFYSSIVHMKESGVVPQPPLNQDFSGKEEGFKLEDYCSLAKSGLCCKQKQGTNLDEWVQEIKKNGGET